MKENQRDNYCHQRIKENGRKLVTIIAVEENAKFTKKN
jgi:hypothetical protein